MLKRMALAALAVVGILGIAGTASAVPTPAPSPALPEGGCATLGRTQTYQSWGPARYYGQPVTVSYSIADCEATLDGTTFAVTAGGTASISDARTGESLETRGFSISGTWSDPTDAGWPLDPFSCEVESARLDWVIDGVFTFGMSAAGGVWSLDVSVPGATDIHFDYAGC